MPKKTVAFSKHTTNIFFHILTQCNLRCRHCYINREQHGRDSLSLNRIKHWLSAFSDRMKEANIVYLGGEPTLHPQLAQAVSFTKNAGAKSVTVDTNGYMFNDFLNKTTPEMIDYISFSLDGAGRRTNDAIRGKGSYDACLSGIRQAVSRGYHASLIYTVSMANITELPLMENLVADLGIERFFIQVLGIRGRSGGRSEKQSGENRSDQMLQVPADRWKQEIPAAAEKIAGRGITVSYPRVFLNPGESFACAGRVAENYFIFPNGRVYRCPLCEDFPINALAFKDDQLVKQPPLNEIDFFKLTIPEGCVMNRLVQPANLSYTENGQPENRIACCMLKEEISPRHP